MTVSCKSGKLSFLVWSTLISSHTVFPSHLEREVERSLCREPHKVTISCDTPHMPRKPSWGRRGETVYRLRNYQKHPVEGRTLRKGALRKPAVCRIHRH